MSARDLYHETVKTALVKDGWTITHDPYSLTFGATDVYIDLGAERIIAAERGTEKIAVEVKSFVGVSTVEDFRNALGQYCLYLALLEQKEPERRLYLAVTNSVFRNVIEEADARRVLERWDVKVMSFDPETMEILQWMS